VDACGRPLFANPVTYVNDNLIPNRYSFSYKCAGMIVYHATDIADVTVHHTNNVAEVIVYHATRIVDAILPLRDVSFPKTDNNYGWSTGEKLSLTP